ncbi:hypothetical protein M5D96_012996 [Drosophila gunungcola]|uniref:ADP-ribosylation factor-binding protein GGA2 n=1 Tax=Drosophila gunungcola TaxID=103775 RepID=A0A9Q0BJA4_9MUSC|nr:hypothetical protein M5D96_012996 [Drosophila gunungcola]
MTTDESIMEEMLERATNPAKKIDELGVQMFCIVVKSNAQLVHKAQEMIVAKVQSTNVTEATRAISLLEECMTQCGDVFQDEAAKFRFLNELIRLVSKKYKGAETPHEVKQRIMECLLLWTTEFPQRQKIRDAYDMLRKEGDIEHGTTEAAVAKRESVLGTIDEAMFAKLIKSNNPENFKRANLLLQYRMAQEARRNDLLAQHRLVLSEVQETMQLLNQMLDSYDPSNQDVSETLHELYKICKKHKPIFQHLPQLLDDSDAQLVADTLYANGALLTTMQRYKLLVPSPTKSTAPALTTSTSASATSATSATSSTAKGKASATTSSTNALLLNELLGDLLISGTESATKAKASSNSNSATVTATATTGGGDPLADLSDIFSSALAESEAAQQQQQQQQQQPFQNATMLLEPQVLNQGISTSEELANGNGNGSDSSKIPGTARKMPQIDMLSEELFQQILPSQERMASFKRDPEKLTLNDLARERMQVKVPEEETGAPAAAPALATADALDDDCSLLSEDVEKREEPPVAPAIPVTPANPVVVKPLSEIHVELDNIQATGEQRIVLDDDDMQLSLNFTSERPGHRVSVIVISAQNKSRQPPCKVRLLPPTDSQMPPHKPFRPATPINQVMLLLNPTGKAVDVTCIVGYKLGDDPDPIKESIVAQGIDYVD